MKSSRVYAGVKLERNIFHCKEKHMTQKGIRGITIIVVTSTSGKSIRWKEWISLQRKETGETHDCGTKYNCLTCAARESGPRKTISSALFMFFATFTSTLALGEHIKESTNGLMGLNEYLMMNSAAGMLHSIIGCQPLLVLRPTGPITLLFEKLLMFADEHSLPFWPFFAWTGIFVGLLMFLIAAFELSKYVKYLTLFTENIFATFIGIVYINDGIQGMIQLWENPAVAGDGTRVPGSQYGSEDAASKLLTLTLRCKFCHEVKPVCYLAWSLQEFVTSKTPDSMDSMSGSAVQRLVLRNMTIGFTALTLWLSTLQSSRLFGYRARSFLILGSDTEDPQQVDSRQVAKSHDSASVPIWISRLSSCCQGKTMPSPSRSLCPFLQRAIWNSAATEAFAAVCHSLPKDVWCQFLGQVLCSVTCQHVLESESSLASSLMIWGD